MSLYILQENQQLLWSTMSKIPKYQVFGQTNPVGRESWFRTIISQFYEANRNRTISIKELQQLNRETISYMVKNLESQEVEPAGVTRDYFSEKKQGELAREFDLRQQEYNGMMKVAPVKEIDFRINTENDGPIENMDELIRKQILERNMDVPLQNTAIPSDTQQYPPGTPEKYNSFQSRIPVIEDGMKTGITERRGGGKGEPPVPPNITIKEEIDFDVTDVTEVLQNPVQLLPIETKNIETKKKVSWSDETIDIRAELSEIKGALSNLMIQMKEIRDFLGGTYGLPNPASSKSSGFRKDSSPFIGNPSDFQTPPSYTLPVFQ
jgi:uncharacterized protein YajQ (UPF0234 family)